MMISNDNVIIYRTIKQSNNNSGLNGLNKLMFQTKKIVFFQRMNPKKSGQNCPNKKVNNSRRFYCN